MNGVFKATLDEMVILPKGNYLVEIADGRITFYMCKGGVVTKGRARKVKAESVTVKVAEDAK